MLAEHVDHVPLIDHHVHGCWLAPGDRARFENGLNEANTEPLADFDSAFDTQIGFAVRTTVRPYSTCRGTSTRTLTGTGAASWGSRSWAGASCRRPG